jgi:hypothetical protein
VVINLANITAVVTIQRTVAVLNGNAVDATLTWLKANITDKLPADATATIVLSNLIP